MPNETATTVAKGYDLDTDEKMKALLCEIDKLSIEEQLEVYKRFTAHTFLSRVRFDGVEDNWYRAYLLVMINQEIKGSKMEYSEIKADINFTNNPSLFNDFKDMYALRKYMVNYDTQAVHLNGSSNHPKCGVWVKFGAYTDDYEKTLGEFAIEINTRTPVKPKLCKKCFPVET